MKSIIAMCSTAQSYVCDISNSAVYSSGQCEMVGLRYTYSFAKFPRGLVGSDSNCPLTHSLLIAMISILIPTGLLTNTNSIGIKI